MAARRLAISSLLCDDDDSSSNRPTSRDSRLSRSPAIVPQPPGSHGPYVSPIHSAFVPTRNPYDTGSPCDAQHYHTQDLGNSPSPASPPPYVPSRSITPPPPGHLPVALQHHTPSLAPSSQLPSPTSHTIAKPYISDRYDEAERVAASAGSHHRVFGFRRHGGDHNQSQRQPISDDLSPSSASPPVAVHEKEHDNRAIAQMTSFSYSQHTRTPISPIQTHFSTTLPPQSSASQNFSPVIPHPVSSRTSDEQPDHAHRVPVFPRVTDTRAAVSQRSSASLSPTVPKSALPSGLDVLVQAATEERERIDVHRKQSGGGEDKRMLSSFSVSRPQTQSPVAFRAETMHIHPSSPKPSPQSAPVHIHSHPPLVQDKQRVFSDGARAVKRRRPSPEPSTPAFETGSPKVEISPPASREVGSTGDLQALDRLTIHQVRNEQRNRVSSISSPTSVTSKDEFKQDTKMERSKPISASAEASSSHSTMQHNIHELANIRRDSTHHPALGLGHPSIHHPIHARRTPPRSRPKPKKPGSVALAAVERELRDVELSEEKGKTEQTMQMVRRQSGDKLTVVQAENTALNFKSHPPIEETASHYLKPEQKVKKDQDAHDFFLSAFDSPSGSSKVVEPKGTNKISVSPKSRAPVQRRLPGSEKSRIPDAHTTQSGITTPDIVLEDQAAISESAAKDVDMNETDADLEELVDAVGPATSGDEGRGFYSEQEGPDTDAMEIDVENELLSLIDGPSEPVARMHHRTISTESRSKEFSASMSMAGPTSLDKLSMHPLDLPSQSSSKTSKKESSKSQSKIKTEHVGGTNKAAKKLAGKTEDAAEKVAKTKASNKARASKLASSEPSKSTKVIKEPAPSVSSTSSPAPVATGSSAIMSDAFPTITSSGRMVMKSKKSAAAAASIAQSSSHSKRKATAGAEASESRSRSHSVIPRASVDRESQKDKTLKVEEDRAKEPEEVEEEEDDKLYCICKTRYDEERIMIACDRCDEWYHTQCLGMPDHGVELVDQFICPVCIERNPEHQLCTTYKQRCFAGLKHPNPDTAEACHKPARGAFSKYCSDECGVRYMHRKIGAWVESGGDVHRLWETVKDAKRPEGIVASESGRTLPSRILSELQNDSNITRKTEATDTKPDTLADLLSMNQENERAVESLNARLQSIVQQREARKKVLEVVLWRERLLRLATERAEKVQECGWDQRLCFGDEEWIEFGEGVLESYEEVAPNGHALNSEDNMEMNVDEQVEDGEWWCRGRKKCDRHAGWQKLRLAEISFEKECTEDFLSKLTKREREIRGRIEDIVHPQSRTSGPGASPKLIFKLANGVSGDGMKKGKKKTTH